MDIETFTIKKYGAEKVLHVGQKVICTYYHEYPDEPNEYNKSIAQRLLDRPFKPVKFGIIVGDAGTQPFWLGADGQEQFLYVKFKEYIFLKAIPISCIEGAKEYAEDMEKFLEQEKGGNDPQQTKARNSLMATMHKAKAFYA